ncbi:helix-turn-helix domain-containing protein [Streptomyces sp. NPDC058464]|uniref:helix-turn-helix domain-containing protein n=1 Tax=Streptomyces sp. NPDC058464 TaxID=3346511 RepID=UPI00365E647E
MSSAGPSETTRPARSKGRDAQRAKDSAATRKDILRAASRRFAERGYAHVTLQEIADDAGVTPALVNRYFVSKRALFELVAQSQFTVGPRWTDAAEFANLTMDYWRDSDWRTPALALVRSIDLDGGTLLSRELERRVREPWRSSLEGDDEVEAKVRLIESLFMGVGLFGLGTLLDEGAEGNQDGLSPEVAEAMRRRITRMLEACLGD